MILKGKTALITGTSRGIGKSIVKRFAEEGCNVYAHARNKTETHEKFCNDLSLSCGVKVTPVYFEATNYNQIKEVIFCIRKESSDINILVNNISSITNKSLFQMSKLEEIKADFEINFFSMLYLTQYISRLMTKNKNGSIINISSVAGLDANTGMIGYVSSKAAVIGATKRLAIELGEYNIRVNSIAPGLANTDMGNMMGKELIETTLNHQIINCMASTNDIANVALFLASDLASHITGQVLRVDGGMLK